MMLGACGLVLAGTEQSWDVLIWACPTWMGCTGVVFPHWAWSWLVGLAGSPRSGLT